MLPRTVFRAELPPSSKVQLCPLGRRHHSWASWLLTFLHWRRVLEGHESWPEPPATPPNQMCAIPAWLHMALSRDWRIRKEQRGAPAVKSHPHCHPPSWRPSSVTDMGSHTLYIHIIHSISNPDKITGFPGWILADPTSVFHWDLRRGEEYIVYVFPREGI